MAKAADVVKIALAEVGYHEKATNAQLDSPTANSGSGNWTKYARDLYNAGYYNGNKNGYAWCDVFVDWCHYQAAGKNATEAQRVQCQTGPLGAACPYSAQYYMAQGRYDRIPRVGDQVFYQQNGELVHTGIVVEVNGSILVCVEGNASDQVKKITYNLSNTYIAGFGHPRYDDVTTGTEAPPTPVVSPTVGNAFTIQLHELKSGCTGPEVKTVQRILYARGCKGADGKDIDVDGEYGANTAAALKRLQLQLGIAQTGTWDAATAQAALTKLD